MGSTTNSTQEADLGHQAALSLIEADLTFFRDLALGYRSSAVSSIGSLALMPFLSAFVYESAMYLKDHDSTIDDLLKPHEDLLRTSRLRHKLLDDSKKSFSEILGHAEELVNINRSWFDTIHHGPFGWLRRMRQTDLGVFFVDAEIVCTTHVAFLNLGISKEKLLGSSMSFETISPFLFETSQDFGRYAGLLMNSPDFSVPALELPPDNSVLPIQYHDLKSRPFYEAIALTVAPGHQSVSLLLTMILSQVNAARILVPVIASQNPIARFKLRFVSLYHAVSALEKLVGMSLDGDFLSPTILRELAELLNAPSNRTIIANRFLRNNLVHYGVHKSISPRLSVDQPLLGLIEAHAPSHTLASLAEDVTIGLDLVAEQLVRMLPKTLTPKSVL